VDLCQAESNKGVHYTWMRQRKRHFILGHDEKLAGGLPGLERRKHEF